ncbi:unnamed protein product [Brachionus calyciflorus]|uniref:CCHC-type domain-containing protein n=1 Tax=Brachionus calyciflorus TaxID=104777 RepID=A0A813M6G3_9BILA|nr:unnamed protein product [Brachionus calyciflorus]
MTRFARKNGIREKKEDKKKPEDATEWNEMFNNNNGQNEKSEDLEIKKQFHKNQLDRKIKNSDWSSFTAGKKLDTKYVMRKFGKSVEKEVMDKLNDMKNKGKITHQEYLEQILREGRSNQRRLERKNERDEKKVCFKCRKPGHTVGQCPEMEKDQEQGTGICYKCGSTEHSISQCKVRLEPGVFPYAKCFICHEMGHITKQCPDNPRGLYPNGGACKSCGSVEHYYRDCPEVQKQNLMVETKTVKKIKKSDNFEILSDEEGSAKQDEPAPKKKKAVFFK